MLFSLNGREITLTRVQNAALAQDLEAYLPYEASGEQSGILVSMM